MNPTNFNEFPNFTTNGYKAIEQLGHNYAGGRITYKAVNILTQQPVVIKQFQFNNNESAWSGFKAYEREIEVLRGLEHPGIPGYLDAFEIATGFCMVQEYKDALSLAAGRSFTLPEVKQIAGAILEILVYLQNCIPPVLHRDIKPENILLDNYGNVTLVDFGFARIGGNDLAASSVVMGTSGFMPPEQLLGRQLT